jgi:nitrite reductase/ring-hydroxylating ferredoxin subunit/uncharacterized membrane protein
MASEPTTSTTWKAPPPTAPRLHALVERLEGAAALDAPAEGVAKRVRGALAPGTAKDLLSGRALGHALHPVLTDAVIGTWTSATILDLVGGKDARPAAERLIGIGILAALPTTLTGVTDWADTTPASAAVRRVGAVHALLNGSVLGLYSASLAARRGGRRGTGVVLGLAGAGVLAVSGHLGGHLSFARGVGVDETAFAEPIADWTRAASAAELFEGEPFLARVAGQEILLVRHDGEIRGLANRCSHRGGPLHEGTLEDGCITCPLHRSRFRLRDGAVDRGPSPYPQPTYDVRIAGDHVEVRSAASRPS